jgi:hypothetical protein
MGIYNPFYSASIDILPVQNVPLKEKLEKLSDDSNKTWGQKCMDALETIGKSQFTNNLKLIENYEMIKGRFIASHYFYTEGYDSTISQLAAELELPNYLRHYDIISPVINTLSGEWQKRPDLLKVRQVGDAATNEYLRTKSEMLQQYIFQKINSEIDKRLLEKGIDINKQDFSSEEEAAQYQQGVEQMRQTLTPPEIQRFMDVDFLTQAEKWGQHHLEYSREVFNLPEKEKIEFEDMLVADRCFRHFYITPTGYNQETWNPVNTFFHKSPDVLYIEDGDYVGRIFHLSLPAIIDRYGYLMNKEDLDLLNGYNKEDKTLWNDNKYNWVYENYLVPFKGYPAYDIMKNSWNRYSNGDIPFLDNTSFNQIYDNDFYRDREGFYFVTEGYWKTQKKIFKITYLDEESGDIVVRLVDENYIIPKHFIESKQLFTDTHDINTYCVTEINETWKGIKINTGVDKNLKKDLYLAIQPNDFQFKGDFNIYGCKLPVCGQVFSIRNSRSMSLVDMMKPHQIGYNVAMNQLYQISEKEIGMFVVMDVNMFPNNKDWGGQDAWGKWMLMAKAYGLLPADTSPANINNSLAATGGFLPKVLDLNLAAQMVSRRENAIFYEQQALKQIGFNEYRLGSFNQSSTATGIQQGMAQSYSQTESHFTNFSNYLRRCHQMDLSIAQYVQGQKEDVAFTYIKSDHSRAFVKILGTDLLLSDLGVFVSNSQEHARQLEMIRQYALNNNTAGMSPVNVADVIMINSPAEIRKQLDISYKALQQQQQQAQQAQQQQVEQAMAVAKEKEDREDIRQDKLLQNNLDREKIKAGVAVINSPTVEDVQIPDNGEFNREKLNLDSSIKREKLELDRQKLKSSNDNEARKLALQQSKIAADIQIQNKETETAKILKNKDLP